MLEIPLCQQECCLVLNERQGLLTLQRWSEDSLEVQFTFWGKEDLKSLQCQNHLCHGNEIRELRAKRKHINQISRPKFHDVWCAPGFTTRICVSGTARFLPTRTKQPHTLIQTKLPGYTVVPSDRALWEEGNKQNPDRKQSERINGRAFWHYLLVEKHETLLHFNKIIVEPRP